MSNRGNFRLCKFTPEGLLDKSVLPADVQAELSEYEMTITCSDEAQFHKIPLTGGWGEFICHPNNPTTCCNWWWEDVMPKFQAYLKTL